MNTISSRIEHISGYKGVIVRAPIMLQRICCVLTSIRKYQTSNTDTVTYCHDDDFDAAFEMIKVGIEHSLVVISMLPTDPKKLRALDPKCPYQWMDVLYHCADEFSAGDFAKLSEVMYQFNYYPSYKRLKTLEEEEYLIKTGHGLYQKTDKLRTYIEEFENRFVNEKVN